MLAPAEDSDVRSIYALDDGGVALRGFLEDGRP
jgi:hypothetical protein